MNNNIYLIEYTDLVTCKEARERFELAQPQEYYGVNVRYIPCELRFFSCMAFSVNEFVRAAFQSRGKAMQERNLCSQRTITVRLRGSLLE